MVTNTNFRQKLDLNLTFTSKTKEKFIKPADSLPLCEIWEPKIKIEHTCTNVEKSAMRMREFLCQS